MVIKFSKRNYYELITGLAPIAAGLMLCAAAPVASAQSYQSATLSPQDCFGGQGISIGSGEGGHCRKAESVKPQIISRVIAPVIAIAPGFNNCARSSVEIFDVDLSVAPEPLQRLGSLPQFGNSHGLTPAQFLSKLRQKYRDNNHGDRAYLDYLFRSLGYSRFKDAQDYMISDELLPIGTRGLMGFGKKHNYGYHILPSSEHDRQAFRVQGANGQIVHFMKSCGNYFYACN